MGGNSDPFGAQFLWLTPDLTHAPLVAAINGCERALVVLGTADPVAPPEARAALSVPLLAFDGLDHGFAGPDEAAAMQRLFAALEGL